jgi:hypothetical protein
MDSSKQKQNEVNTRKANSFLPWQFSDLVVRIWNVGPVDQCEQRANKPPIKQTRWSMLVSSQSLFLSAIWTKQMAMRAAEVHRTSRAWTCHACHNIIVTSVHLGSISTACTHRRSLTLHQKKVVIGKLIQFQLRHSRLFHWFNFQTLQLLTKQIL